MTVKLMQCSCKHADQDRRYGKQVRVHNYSLKKKAWRCTVCKSEKAD
jgi:hypothetical protein